MRTSFRDASLASAMAIVVMVLLGFPVTSIVGQEAASRIPRTVDGKPNLNGIWQAVNTANWDLQDHTARQGPVVTLGASFSVPAGLGVVVGNEIPYKPEALAKKKENFENWMKLDPEIKCYMPGVPRGNYQGFPFQILQTPQYIHIAYEFASAFRAIYMDSKKQTPCSADPPS